MKALLLGAALTAALSAPARAEQICFDRSAAVAPSPATSPLLQTYMRYIEDFHGSTHTDGWNLDEMGLTGADRDALSSLGVAIEGRGQ